MRKVRRHNRQIHKMTVQKCGYRKLNQAPYKMYGFRLFDKVQYKGKECFIYARRRSGYFMLRTFDGTMCYTNVSHKKLKFIEPRNSYITERRKPISPTRKALEE